MMVTDNVDFIAVPIVFYIVVAAAQLNLEDLRRDGWVFEMIGGHEAWYRFYSYFGRSSAWFDRFSIR